MNEQVAPGATAPTRPTWRFAGAHPARAIAFGFGAGLGRIAPGTAGTLWAWATFLLLDRALGDTGWAIFLGISMVLGVVGGDADQPAPAGHRFQPHRVRRGGGVLADFVAAVTGTVLGAIGRFWEILVYLRFFLISFN